MTMPHELTRALRYGWEFLLELQAADCLTLEQRETVTAILRHYPDAAEIRQWAIECGQDRAGRVRGIELEPEEVKPQWAAGPVYPDAIERGPVSPRDRALAISAAWEFFFFKLRGGEEVGLTPELRRQLPYVLRHMPEAHQVETWARVDDWLKSKDTGRKQWLSAAAKPNDG